MISYNISHVELYVQTLLKRKMNIKTIEGNNTKQKSVNKRMRTPDIINKLKRSSI